jgi:hypothetical protein
MAYSNSGIFTRSEFEGRGVIKLAPDILVYIGGNQSLRVIAPVSSDNNYTASFNDGITSVNVQNNVDPPGSSTASIEITTPIYGEKSKYWVGYEVNGTTVRHSVFLPMMEVKIFMKGRYIVDGNPRYYPVFWGLINSIDESYSGGVYTISLQCGDLLSWLDKSTMNIHPVPESRIAAGGGQKLTVYATIFDKANPYTIVYDMIHRFFDIDKKGASELFVTPTWVGQKTNYSYNFPTEQFKLAMQGLSNYWRERFSKIGTNLKMFGASGKSLDKLGNIIPNSIPPNDPGNDTIYESLKGPRDVFNIDGELRKFIPLADYQKMGSFDSAEYQSKLTLLTEIKNKMQFELYQDVNGSFIFKPPFYNMDVKGVFPYTFYPNEIISCSFQINSEGIVSVLETKTAMHKLLKETAMARGIGFHMDMEMAAKYGIRFHDISLEYTDDANIARSLAVGEMSKVNAKCYTGNITIPGRPEMKLGYPIYIVHRYSYHYVKSINHQFDYGGSCSTTLSLEAERRIRKSEDGSDTGPNKGFVFKKKISKKQLEQTDQKESDIIKKDLEGRSGRKVGIPSGVYDIQDSNAIYPTNTSIPITDSKGYQLIGAFPYGRNVNPINGRVSDGNTNYNIASISPSNSSAGESEKMKEIFSTNKDIELSIPSYITSPIIDTNPLNSNPVDIKPNDVIDRVSSNLLESVK